LGVHGLRGDLLVHDECPGRGRFCRHQGIDPDALVAGNDQGIVRKLCGDWLAGVAPSWDEMAAILRELGTVNAEPVTEDDYYRSWKRLFEGGTRSSLGLRRGGHAG
jgi:hypothetical protein